MSFQGNEFKRTQDFARDRDLGPPNDTIDAAKVDDEFDNIAAGLSTLAAEIDGIDGYTKAQADDRFAGKSGTATAIEGKLDKAGGTVSGALAINAPVTLGGKAGAAKGIVNGGTVTFDYADGNVQTIVVAGNVTFDFANLPNAGGSLQINIAVQSGSITVAGTTWWELGAGEKSTAFTDIGVVLLTGRPYRMILEMVAGYRTGLFT